MKRTIILLWCMLIAFSAFSKVLDTRDIYLKAKKANNGALRTITPVKAFLEGNTVFIKFLDSPDNVIITMKDSQGSEIATEVYKSPQFIQFQTLQLSGSYTLEITYADTCLYGDFVIE